MLFPGCEPEIRPFPLWVVAALLVEEVVEEEMAALLDAAGSRGDAFAGGPLNGFTTKISPETIASPTNTTTE